MNKKTAIWIAVIFASALVISTYLWASHNRYDIVVGDGSAAYEVDRKTGKTWYIRGDRKIPHSK